MKIFGLSLVILGSNYIGAAVNYDWKVLIACIMIGLGGLFYGYAK